MIQASRVPVAWRPRETPLRPVAAAACGEAARALARRLLAREDPVLGRLAGVASEGVLLVLGEPDDLPWVEGIVYLGRDPEAAGLLVPSAREPDVPLALFERALRDRFPAATPPLAVLPGALRVISAGESRSLSREALAAWVEGGA